MPDPAKHGIINRKIIVDAVTQATTSVYSMMANLEVAPQEALDHAEPEPVTRVAAVLGFTGDWLGTGMLLRSERFACRVGSAMLLCEVQEVNGDVLDGIGEMANMILGNFKESMESHVGPLLLSVPIVVYGKNFSTRTPLKAMWTIVPFKIEDETFEVRVCIKPKRTN